MSSSASNWWQISPAYGGMTVTAVTNTSTAETALVNGGGRYMFTAYTNNAFIRFGVTGMSAAAFTTGNFDMDIPIGQKGVIMIPPSVTHFRVISDTAGPGSLVWGKVGN